MRKNRTKWMTYNGLLAAIIVVMAMVPFLGFLTFGAVAIQLISIPVIIGGILFGWKSATFLSLVFGLFSMFVAATRGGAGDLIFTNPLVSVLPRLLFGLSIVPIYNMVKGLVKNEDLSAGITALLSTLVHSVVVIVALFIVLGIQTNSFNTTFSSIIGALITVNVLVEALAAVIIVVPVVKALRRIVD